MLLLDGFDDVAFPIVGPAVIEATEAALFDAAAEQRGAAMTTVLGQQPGLAGGVAEENQVLPEHSDPDGVAGCSPTADIRAQVRRALNGKPEAPPHLARGSPGAHADQRVHLFVGKRHPLPPIYLTSQRWLSHA